MAAEKERVQVDLEATVEHLTEKLKDLKTENTELKEIQALMETKTVTSFQDGKYNDEIREVVITLLTSGVSMSKFDGVIRTALESLANMTVHRLPSRGLQSRLLVEADILAKCQVAEALLSGEEQNKRNCLHQDGTSKFFKKYQTFDETLPSGRALTMSMSEIPSGDAAGITASFKESCRELAEVLCSPGEDVAKKTAQIVTSFTTTSDRGATNPLFNEQLQDMRRELLPVVEDNWDSLTDEVKDELSKMCNYYFCKMHLLVNFGAEANSTLKVFEDAVSQGKIPWHFHSRESRVLEGDEEWQFLKVVGNNNLQPIFGRGQPQAQPLEAQPQPPTQGQPPAHDGESTDEAGKAEMTKAKKKMTSRRDRLFKSRLRVALELLNEEEYGFFQHSGPMYMSDEESDEEDKTVVWVKPPQWRTPRLTDMVLRCQAVLDLNRRNNTTPSSNKERKRKDLDFTDRLRPSGRAAEMYI
uniref:Uncharacterized protein n=2 Tax=Branchiostoma floridae TaxID=7739 RepID=C3Y881_BRAFL|eukprot:XP_002607540.1 hypothetical protein BRAFLDRAFT_106488 [Branchiostoma floridae]